MSKIIEMARESKPHGPIGDGSVLAWFERFAALVAKAERERCLSCYSPDDTATDWEDKIRALGDEVSE